MTESPCSYENVLNTSGFLLPVNVVLIVGSQATKLAPVFLASPITDGIICAILAHSNDAGDSKDETDTQSCLNDGCHKGLEQILHEKTAPSIT